MLQALIRRKIGGASVPDEFAEESTVFSLSTEVPRPTEGRTSERLQTMLPAAKLVTNGRNYFCRIKNISAGGLTAEVAAPIEAQARVAIEFNSEQQIHGTVVWTRAGLVGVKFDNDADLRRLLGGSTAPDGMHPRPPRLEVSCGATVRIGRLYHTVEVRDISLGGMKVALRDWQCAGKDVVVTIESFRSIRGRVRWYEGGLAGIVFDKPLGFDELAAWMGKRLEIAALRTSACERTR